MIRPKHIPDAVVEAAGESFLKCDRVPSSSFDDCIRAAIAAALNAWPSGSVCHYRMSDSEGLEMVMPLPFPQEKQG